MDINLHGITGSVHFMWDMPGKNYGDMMAPLPEEMHDMTDYMGAVFFGNFKLDLCPRCSILHSLGHQILLSEHIDLFSGRSNKDTSLKRYSETRLYSCNGLDTITL